MNVTRAATSAQVLLHSVSASLPLSLLRLLVRYGRTTAIQRSRRRSYNAASSYDLYDHRTGTCSLEEFRFHSRDERRRKSHSASTGTGFRGTSTLREHSRRSHMGCRIQDILDREVFVALHHTVEGFTQAVSAGLASFRLWASPITGRWRRW